MSDSEVKKGPHHYLVQVSLHLEVEVTDVESEDEARRIVDTLEAKVSPWAAGHTTIQNQDTDVDQVEPLDGL